MEELPQGAMVLDVGCGRGLWAFHMARAGFRVIGVDYVPEVIAKNNEEVKNYGLGKNVRFKEADVLDIPFTDTSFDGVIDVGLLDHLPPEEIAPYISEVGRVLKQGGYFLNISFSKETVTYLTWHPKQSDEDVFVKDGVSYHFFTKEKIAELFKGQFEIVEQMTEYFPDYEDLAYVVTLMKKK